MNPYYRQQISCPNGQIYIIRAGDTIYRLSQRFGTTVDAIIAANPGIDPDRLYVGQQICIPVQSISCPNGQIYVIQSGDTIYRLAQRYGVSVDAIIRANPGIDPDRLYIGQRICIPLGQPKPCNGEIYTIKTGDTYYKLAQKFGVPVDAIVKANPGVNPYALFVGQQICIPKVEIDCPSNNVYIVQPGDTLYRLGQKFNVAMEAILANNPQITDPNNLVVGQPICVPSPMVSDPFDGVLDRDDEEEREVVESEPEAEPEELPADERDEE